MAKLIIKPKFYKDELDNPFVDKDETKAVFWKWERMVFGSPGANGEVLKHYITRGIELLMDDSATPGSADDIPPEIKDATASLEEKALVAQMYSNEVGTNMMLRDDPMHIKWTEYCKD